MSLIVKISSLGAGSNELQFSFKPEEIGLQPPFTGTGTIKLDMQKTHHQLIVNTELVVQYDSICDRCGEKVFLSPQSQFSLVYIFETPETESEDFNVRYLAPETDKINMAQEVFDYAQLSIPLKILCKDDCKGLCRYCGINKNSGSCECSESEKGSLWESVEELKKKLKYNNKS